ncbi:type II secretion system minor pseudopilin GspK [Paracidovorax citrulli]
MSETCAPRAPAPRPCRRRPRGAAVVTALLVVTLAVVIVSGLLWRQQVQIRSVENQRLMAQAAWIQRAAVDWGRLILRDDLRRSNVDHLGEPWAVPVAETRLSDFLGASLRTDRAGETSFLSGRILDAQARFNLRNLVRTSVGAEGRRVVAPDPDALESYRRLLQVLGVNPNLAETTARYLADAQRADDAGARNAPRPPDSIEDLLAVPGYEPQMLPLLEAYAVILPERTAVNVNTAEPEVLAAVIPQLPLDRARELARQRDRAFFNNLGDMQTRLRTIAPDAEGGAAGDTLDVRSHYFLVFGLIRHERAARQQVSLVRRAAAIGSTEATRIVWVRDVDRLPEMR